ncbi:MAG: hypothetical protein AAB796_03050 [Patescibacteria group bacterium]
MTQSLRNLILKKVFEIGQGMLDGFFPAKYPEARMWRGILGLDEKYVFSKRTFSSILSKLRKEGLVERIGARKESLWTITQKGKNYIQNSISPKHDGITRIIIFDIPEKERKKRRWLRENLLGLEYRQLQKSVWIGDAPLSEKFYKDSDILSLREYVHVFKVVGDGTLRDKK